MSLNRHAKKRDLNEGTIKAFWTREGCWVETVNASGSPDTRVHFEGAVLRAEVKGAKRGLTPAQVKNFTEAHENRVPTYIVRTLADAEALLNGTLEPWKPEDGALAGAVRKERAHKPGASKARRVTELCGEDFCPRSRAPGSPWCRGHARPPAAPGRWTP